MFGLGGQKNEGFAEFIFELENELKKPARHKEIKANIEAKIQKVKDFLRSGENQEDFDQLGLLLHGYTSLLKVISRFKS